MKHLLFLALVFVALSCTKSDSELLVGKWQFSRISSNGQVMVSDNPKEQKVIIDRAVKEMKKKLSLMNMTEATYRKAMKEDIDLMLKVTFEFKNDSTLIVSNNITQKLNESRWTYKINPTNKELTIDEEMRTIVYTYQIKDKRLIISEKKDKIEFVKAEN
jgi:hypothetical protein